MAQVNSEPGVSQTPTTIVVPKKSASAGVEPTRGAATLTTVAYGQTEPGVVVTKNRS